jgi:CheY-like chemotaxis protein
MNLAKNPIDNKPGSLVTCGRILLVDDEPVVRAMTSAVLTAMGWETVSARSGEEAVKTLEILRMKGETVDMIILDLILPCGMGGLQVSQEFRRIQPNVRILACSGFFGDAGKDACLAMGFHSTLAKPFTAEDLSHAVNHCIRGEASPQTASAVAA